MTDTVLADTDTDTDTDTDADVDGVRTPTFHRPDSRNGWSEELENGNCGHLTAAADPDVRVVVTGAGPTFCPAADLGWLGALAQVGAARPRRPVDVPRSRPKPLVAAIDGARAGGGRVPAWFCHVRLAADTARSATARTRRGLLAEAGIAWTLPRTVGPANADRRLRCADLCDGPQSHLEERSPRFTGHGA